MELKVGSVVFKVIIVRDVIGNILVEQHRRLVGPTSCHVADGVATAAQDEGGHLLGKLQYFLSLSLKINSNSLH